VSCCVGVSCGRDLWILHNEHTGRMLVVPSSQMTKNLTKSSDRVKHIIFVVALVGSEK